MFICIITELSQVCLAIYDIPIESVTYTSSENIDITINKISLNFPIKINDEIVMHPRSGGCILKCMLGLQALFFFNINDRAQPIAICNSLDQYCELFGDVDIPNFHDRNSINNLIANIGFSNYYNKTEIEIIVANPTYTNSENIGITNSQISLDLQITINDEIVLHPRAYGIQFEMHAGTSGFAFLQNLNDGGQPIAMFNSLDRSCDLFGDVDIPCFIKLKQFQY